MFLLTLQLPRSPKISSLVFVWWLQKFVRDMRWQDGDDGDVAADCDAKVETLDDLEISDEIAKGCNAVVYRARIKGRWRDFCSLDMIPSCSGRQPYLTLWVR